jgi:hypothetical protein
VKAIKVPTAPTAGVRCRAKDPLSLRFLCVSPRSLSVRCGRYSPYAGDDGKYRPQESLANGHIEDGAGDAVGIVRR